MEKIIKIDGKEVRLKSSAALPLKYKAQTGRDVFSDLAKMEKITGNKEGMSVLDTEAFFNIIWVLAKCADSSIPPVIEWVDSFEAFPVFEIFEAAGELITFSMGTTQKNAVAATD